MWFEDRPDLLEDIKNSLSVVHQDLSLRKRGHKYSIVGTWQVRYENESIDEYEIKIIFQDEYPVSLPLVYEIGSRIPRNPDRHLNPPRWEACLFLEIARWEVWPVGASFLDFLQKPVHNFFLSQSYFERKGRWPLGQYGHGEVGVLEYLSEKLGTTDLVKLKGFCDGLLQDRIPRQWRCPCASGLRFKKCHGDLVQGLKKNWNKKEIQQISNAIKRNGQTLA